MEKRANTRKVGANNRATRNLGAVEIAIPGEIGRAMVLSTQTMRMEGAKSAADGAAEAVAAKVPPRVVSGLEKTISRAEMTRKSESYRQKPQEGHASSQQSPKITQSASQ